MKHIKHVKYATACIHMKRIVKETGLTEAATSNKQFLARVCMAYCSRPHTMSSSGLMNAMA
jgi:hypothetical protein